jgi:hypothetical protein
VLFSPHFEGEGEDESPAGDNLSGESRLERERGVVVFV